MDLPKEHIETLEKFVETGTELPKTELLHRIQGRVEKALEKLLIVLQFHSIRKDSEHNIALL